MNTTSTHVFYLLFALFLIRGISERMALFGALRAPVERIQQHHLYQAALYITSLLIVGYLLFAAIEGVLSHGNYFLLLFFISGSVFTFAEYFFPFQEIDFKGCIKNDLVAFFTVHLLSKFKDLLVVPIVMFTYSVLGSFELLAGLKHFVIDSYIVDYSLVYRIVMLFLVSDLIYYWLHRLLHTRLCWRMHLWHHSIEQLYWFSGVRASFLDNVIRNFSSILLAWFFLPNWIFIYIIAVTVLADHWMHANIRFRMKWLEWVMVTPRFHRLHHANHPSVYNASFGGYFTFWDRLFGTYQDADDFDDDLALGVSKKPNAVWMATGV